MIEVLNDYRPINACDEMMDEALHVYPHWQPIYDALATSNIDEMAAKQVKLTGT